MELKKKRRTNRESIRRNTETPKMILRTEMRMVDLNSYTLMVHRSMWENPATPYWVVDLLVFPQTDHLHHSIWVSREENYLSWDPCNFSMMISLRRKTTKKYKTQFLDGWWWTRETLSKALRMSPNWVNTTTYRTLLPLQIDWDHVFKNPMSSPKTLQLCSVRSCTNLTLI